MQEQFREENRTNVLVGDIHRTILKQTRLDRLKPVYAQRQLELLAYAAAALTIIYSPGMTDPAMPAPAAQLIAYLRGLTWALFAIASVIAAFYSSYPLLLMTLALPFCLVRGYSALPACSFMALLVLEILVTRVRVAQRLREISQLLDQAINRKANKEIARQD